MGAGVGLADTVAAFVPLPLPIPGASKAIVGYAMSKYLLKSGMGNAFATGVLAAGVGDLIRSAIGGSLSLGGATSAGTQVMQ